MVPTDELDNFYLGFYKVLSNFYLNVYEINFSPNIKARKFLNASRLMKVWDDVVPGQILIPPNLVEINGELEWIVDKILFFWLYYQKLQYKVAWKGHDPNPEWHSAKNFKHAPKKLQKYYRANSGASEPSARLEHWITAALNDHSAEDHPDDNYPVALAVANSGLKRRRNAWYPLDGRKSGLFRGGG
jgi:hypothetical protein